MIKPRIIIFSLALHISFFAQATKIEKKTLSELMAVTEHVFIGTVMKVDMLDGVGNEITDLEARTGPGIENVIRLHVEING